MLWVDWLQEVRELTEEQFLAKYPISALVFISSWPETKISNLKDTPEHTALPSTLKKDTRLDLFKTIVRESKAKSIFFLKERVKVGRASDVDIQISLEGLSRHHAEFTFIPGWNGWAIIDRCSKNGTFLNGEKLHPALPYTLDNEMIIDFGKEATAVYYEPKELQKIVSKELLVLEKLGVL
jgi:pSer/pThr/pTyr-binding forkhead associated (FHA) protein